MDTQKFAEYVYDIITDESEWIKIKEFYDAGAYNSDKLNPYHKKIDDFSSLSQRMTFYINIYQQDMILEAPLFLNQVSVLVKKMIDDGKRG